MERRDYGSSGRGRGRGNVRRGGVSSKRKRSPERTPTRELRRGFPSALPKIVKVEKNSPAQTLAEKISKVVFDKLFFICLVIENEETNVPKNKKDKNKNNTTQTTSSIPKEKSKPIIISEVVNNLLFGNILESNFVVLLIFTDKKMKYSQLSKNSSISFQCEQCSEIRSLSHIKVRSSLRRKAFFLQKNQDAALSNLLSMMNTPIITSANKYLIQFPNYPVPALPVTYTKFDLSEPIVIRDFSSPIWKSSGFLYPDLAMDYGNQEDPINTVFNRVYSWIAKRQLENSLPKSKSSFLNTIKSMCSVKLHEKLKLEIAEQIANEILPFFHRCNVCSAFQFRPPQQMNNHAISSDLTRKKTFDKVVSTLSSSSHLPATEELLKYVFFNFIPSVNVEPADIFFRLVEREYIIVGEDDDLIYNL